MKQRLYQTYQVNSYVLLVKVRLYIVDACKQKTFRIQKDFVNI